MQVQWATNEKAVMASTKHFNGAFTAAQMTTVATAMIKRADMVGVSDRSNGNYAPARIVWATFNNTKYAVVLDSKDIKKGAHPRQTRQLQGRPAQKPTVALAIVRSIL